MANFDEQEEICECIICSLTEEFKALIKDKVDWESALRHVLHVMASDVNKSDEELADLVDESFVDGYSQGLADGVEKAQSMMFALVEDTDDQVALMRAEYGLDEDIVKEAESEIETEEIEDLTDEQVDEIQKIINGDL